jgi:hypothetical protein
LSSFTTEAFMTTELAPSITWWEWFEILSNTVAVSVAQNQNFVWSHYILQARTARAYNDSSIVVLAVLWHFVLSHSMPVRGTAPRWTKEAANEVERQFNLYTKSNGQEGWDPRNRDASYIKPLAQKNDVLRPYSAGNLGGHELHKDSTKILRGYEREWQVSILWNWQIKGFDAVRSFSFIVFILFLLLTLVVLFFLYNNRKVPERWRPSYRQVMQVQWRRSILGGRRRRRKRRRRRRR